MLNVWHKQMTSSFEYMTSRLEVEPDHVLVHFQPQTWVGDEQPQREHDIDKRRGYEAGP